MTTWKPDPQTYDQALHEIGCLEAQIADLQEQLAEAVSQTIGSPIRRAQFVADAAADLARLDYQPFEGLDGKATSLAETAEAERPTPCGSTELWGSLLQGAEPA